MLMGVKTEHSVIKDPVVYGIAAATLLVAVSVACYWPARRDPMIAWGIQVICRFAFMAAPESHLHGIMGAMKTTVELPDDLLIAAKKRADEMRRPLRSLIEEGLRMRLEAHAQAKPRPKKRLRWPTVPGGVPADLDLSDRAKMHDWLRLNR